MTENTITTGPLLDVARLIVAGKFAHNVESHGPAFDDKVSAACELLRSACEQLADEFDPDREGTWSEVRNELTREFRQNTESDEAKENNDDPTEGKGWADQLWLFCTFVVGDSRVSEYVRIYDWVDGRARVLDGGSIVFADEIDGSSGIEAWGLTRNADREPSYPTRPALHGIWASYDGMDEDCERDYEEEKRHAEAQ